MSDRPPRSNRPSARPPSVPTAASDRIHSVFNPPELMPLPGAPAWRRRAYEIIFEAESKAGRTFDLWLLVAILTSVLAVVLDSVPAVHAAVGTELFVAEWILTGLFTLEYGVRLACVRRPLTYATSFFGVVDLVAIAPVYLGFFVPGAHVLMSVRLLRVLRIFRLLRLSHFVGQSELLATAIVAARHKIAVFVGTVMAVVVIMGALMVVVEGAEQGFTSIPTGMYWAVVTLTTVGYGDIAPITAFGRTIAALIMLLGYAIIAVPTGIVTVELAEATRRANPNPPCPRCGHQNLEADSRYCCRCGERLARDGAPG